MCCNCFYSLSFSILKIFLAPFQERKQKNCLPHDGPFLKKVKSQFFSIASIDTFRVNLTFNCSLSSSMKSCFFLQENRQNKLF